MWRQIRNWWNGSLASEESATEEPQFKIESCEPRVLLSATALGELIDIDAPDAPDNDPGANVELADEIDSADDLFDASDDALLAGDPENPGASNTEDSPANDVGGTQAASSKVPSTGNDGEAGRRDVVSPEAHPAVPESPPVPTGGGAAHDDAPTSRGDARSNLNEAAQDTAPASAPASAPDTAATASRTAEPAANNDAATDPGQPPSSSEAVGSDDGDRPLADSSDQPSQNPDATQADTASLNRDSNAPPEPSLASVDPLAHQPSTTTPASQSVVVAGAASSAGSSGSVLTPQQQRVDDLKEEIEERQEEHREELEEEKEEREEEKAAKKQSKTDGGKDKKKTDGGKDKKKTDGGKDKKKTDGGKDKKKTDGGKDKKKTDGARDKPKSKSKSDGGKDKK